MVNDIISALKKITSDPQQVMNEKTRILEDLGLESIDFVDFIFELEKVVGSPIDITHLSVTLSKQTGRRFREVTIGEIADYLNNHIVKK